jgi:hypothetical protein
MSGGIDGVAEAERAFIAARMKFLTSGNRLGAIRDAIRDPVRRGTALRLLHYLSDSERESLFDDLLEIAAVDHSDIELVRQALMSLPREWVVGRIEDQAEPLLSTGTYVEFRRLLELYKLLDPELTARLARRARESADPDIREAGEDFSRPA